MSVNTPTVPPPPQDIQIVPANDHHATAAMPRHRKTESSGKNRTWIKHEDHVGFLHEGELFCKVQPINGLSSEGSKVAADAAALNSPDNSNSKIKSLLVKHRVGTSMLFLL